MEEKKVLVTGGNGFIGSNLIRRLIDENAEVNVLIREKTDRIQDLSGKTHLHKADLSDFKSVKMTMEKIQPSLVYHLAAFPDLSPSHLNTNTTIQVNIQGTVNLIHALEKCELDAFVHIGSYKEYGNNKVPFKENQPLKPTSAYAVSKASAELYCKLYNELYQFPAVMLRFPTVYGPWDNPYSLISSIIRACLERKTIILTEGRQKRELIFVSDAIDAIVKSSITKRAIGEILNIGSGIEYSIKYIVKKIIKMMGNVITPNFGALSYRETEIWHMYGDNSNAKKLLKWSPNVGLEEGLRRTIAWKIEKR